MHSLIPPAVVKLGRFAGAVASPLDVLGIPHAHAPDSTRACAAASALSIFVPLTETVVWGGSARAEEVPPAGVCAGSETLTRRSQPNGAVRAAGGRLRMQTPRALVLQRSSRAPPARRRACLHCATKIGKYRVSQFCDRRVWACLLPVLRYAARDRSGGSTRSSVGAPRGRAPCCLSRK